jgi:hypothetical protein
MVLDSFRLRRIRRNDSPSKDIYDIKNLLYRESGEIDKILYCNTPVYFGIIVFTLQSSYCPLFDLRLVLPPTNKCGIKRVREVRQENSLLPGSKNPDYSLFPASLSHDKMIGPTKSPCHAGGLVGRHILSYRKTNRGGGAMTKLFVGIDVAKDMSSAQGIDSTGRGCFSLTVAMDSGGFIELWTAIMLHCKDLSEVIIAVESTACYHINLFSFFTAKGVNTVVINPLLISNFAKLSLRKTKTDKKDAMTIAQFLLVHRDAISHLSLSQDLQDFRDIAREKESVSHMISAHKVEIKRILQTTFPELENLCNITCNDKPCQGAYRKG